MRILLAEDEPKMAAFISKALQEEGCTLDILANGDDTLKALMQGSYEVAVLDIMLNGRDGLSVLKLYRERGGKTPVIMVSARGHVTERMEGLNAGADDYLPKPFVVGELIARVRALARRAAPAGPMVLRLADLTLDTMTRRVERRGEHILLAPREYALLEFLMKSGEQVRGRTAILEAVWDYHFDPGTNLVDVYIRRLRDKLDRGFEVKLVHTVVGVGYALRAAV